MKIDKLTSNDIQGLLNSVDHPVTLKINELISSVNFEGVLTSDLDLYVEFDGDDNAGDGSIVSPYKTIKAALDIIPTFIDAEVLIHVGTVMTGQVFVWNDDTIDSLNRKIILTNGRLEITSNMVEIINGLTLVPTANPFIYSGLTCSANQYRGKYARQNTKKSYPITSHSADSIVTHKGVGTFDAIVEHGAVLLVDKNSMNGAFLAARENRVIISKFHVVPTDTGSTRLAIRSFSKLNFKHCYFDMSGAYMSFRGSVNMIFNKCLWHATLVGTHSIETEFRYCSWMAVSNTDGRMVQFQGMDPYISEGVFDGGRGAGRSNAAMSLINSKLHMTESNVDDYSFYIYNCDTVFTGINYSVKLSNESLQEFRIDPATVDHLVGIGGIENYGNINVRLPGLTSAPGVSMRADGADEFSNPTRNLTIDTPFTSYPTSGTTAGRPTGIGEGGIFFDTTLGQPIWWTGSGWVDADGTAV